MPDLVGHEFEKSLAREPIAESDNVHMVFELGEGILERRWI